MRILHKSTRMAIKGYEKKMIDQLCMPSYCLASYTRCIMSAWQMWILKLSFACFCWKRNVYKTMYRMITHLQHKQFVVISRYFCGCQLNPTTLVNRTALIKRSISSLSCLPIHCVMVVFNFPFSRISLGGWSQEFTLTDEL